MEAGERMVVVQRMEGEMEEDVYHQEVETVVEGQQEHQQEEEDVKTGR
jgi:hypothetical protein